MIATRHGKGFLRLQVGDTVVAVNPSPAEGDSKGSRFGSDVVLCTSTHESRSEVMAASYGDKDPFVIKGPGSYEVGDILIRGFAAGKAEGGYLNTSYIVTIDGIKVLILGDLSASTSVTAELREAASSVDMIFVNIGDQAPMKTAEIFSTCKTFTPGMIIPLDYSPESLETFVKQGSNSEEMSKLTVKVKDLQTIESEIRVLTV